MIRKGQREWVGQEKENKFFLLKKKKKKLQCYPRLEKHCSKISTWVGKAQMGAIGWGQVSCDAMSIAQTQCLLQI